MRNQFIKLTTLALFATSAMYAGGYKIPETSTNAVALGAANIANNKNADAAYYNPANMVFMSNKNHLEADLMYIGLDPTKYTPQTGNAISAKSESFVIPSLHYVSQEFVKNMRFGMSVVVPGGLTKRWTDSPALDSAEEFSLEVVEVNPTVAYKISDSVGVALGLRMVHSSGVVKSTSTASRDMNGESFDFGYNVAFTYKPMDAFSIGLTYRSKIDLSIEGNAKLYLGDSSGAKVYDGGASVTVPLPASADIAMAYTFETGTTLEAVYERVFWSAWKELDFNYVSSIPTLLQPSFDDPKARDWKDTNTFRFGVTQELKTITLMAGLVIDETPAPSKTLGYELPDSNSISVSLGGRYQINNQFDVGIAALYSMHSNRTISTSDANENNIVGEFSNSNVFLISAGIGYKF